MKSLSKIRSYVDQQKAEYKVLKRQAKSKREELEACGIALQNIARAQEIVQTIARTIQEEVHGQIAAIVTQCLEIVFEEPYTFKILFEQKRNRTEARLVFERNGLEIDPMSAAGGGVVDVAAFALRLACLVLHKPKLNRVLILDEPFKYVSQEYLPNVCEMLEKLSLEMRVQIIMVTHIGMLRTGKVINVD